MEHESVVVRREITPDDSASRIAGGGLRKVSVRFASNVDGATEGFPVESLRIIALRSVGLDDSEIRSILLKHDETISQRSMVGGSLRVTGSPPLDRLNHSITERF